MSPMRKRHYLAGTTSALGGTALIFALVIGINEFASRNNYDDRARQTAFEVDMMPDQPEPLAPPEPPPEPEPVEPEPPPPMAELNSDIGSVDIPVPGLDDRALDAMSGDRSADGDLVMTDETVDEPPRPTRQAAMEYPAAAKRNGVTGYVLLSLLIDDRGNVERVRVLESEPAEVFDQVASAAVQDWQFDPAVYQGKPVRVWARQRIRFDLD